MNYYLRILILITRTVKLNYPCCSNVKKKIYKPIAIYNLLPESTTIPECGLAVVPWNTEHSSVFVTLLKIGPNDLFTWGLSVCYKCISSSP
jgi:hypothetical protein